jgi:orotate phosphoribosyltransferase
MQKNPLLDIFKTTGALLEGHFKLTSGRHSPQYFQCALVLQHPDPLQLISGIIVDHFRSCEIDTVISPAIGGIVVGTEVGRQLGKKTVFTERKDGVMSLRRGFTVMPGEKFLVIEDVITTGGSVKEVIELIEAAGGIVVGVGSVVDRSNGKVRLSDKQFSALVLEAVSYSPEECPLCKADIPIEKPGSRPGK